MPQRRTYQIGDEVDPADLIEKPTALAPSQRTYQIGEEVDPSDLLEEPPLTLEPSATPSRSMEQPAPHPLAQLGEMAVGAGTGLLKQAGERAVDIGQLAEQIPGVSALSEAMGTPKPDHERARKILQPTGTAESIGKGAGQIAEVLIPGRAITATGQKLAAALAPRLAPAIGKTAAQVAPRAAVEAAGSAGIAAAQGGDPTTAAALGAAVPVAGRVLPPLARHLRRGSEKQVQQALVGPAKERLKSIAERRTPEVLARGLTGGRESLQRQARAKIPELGRQIGAVLEEHGGKPLPTAPILDALEQSKSAFQTTRTMPLTEAAKSGIDLSKPGITIAGETVSIPIRFEQRPIQQIEKLQRTIQEYGPEMTARQADAVRKAWGRVVSNAGGFQHRARGAIGVPLKEQDEAWAKREAYSAIRERLDEGVEGLAPLNKEISFWKDIDEMTTRTLQKTTPQEGGLGRLIMKAGGYAVGGGAGGAAGGFAGAGAGALVGGEVMARVHSAMRSPTWRLASAQLKNQLAKALVDGKTEAALSALGRIVATQGSKVPVPLAPVPAGAR